MNNTHRLFRLSAGAPVVNKCRSYILLVMVMAMSLESSDLLGTRTCSKMTYEHIKRGRKGKSLGEEGICETIGIIVRESELQLLEIGRASCRERV